MPARAPLAVALAAVVALLPAVAFADSDSNQGVESLLDIYEQAIAADPQLRSQRLQLDELREQRRETFGGLLPQATARAEATRVRRDQISVSGGVFADEEEEETRRNFTLEQYQVNIIQPLYDVGTARRLDQAESEVDRGEFELAAAEQEIVARVTEAYLAVLSAQSEVDLARRDVEAIEAAQERVEALYEERMADITELEEVRARRDSARARALRAESDLDRAREELAELTDARHYRLAGLSADADLPAIDPDDIDAWVARALEQNPEILAAEAAAEASRHAMRAARGEHYPSADLTAGYRRLDELDGTRFGREIEDWTIGVQIELPLYSGGSVSAAARGAESRRDQELEALESTRRGVRTQVRGAFRSLASARNEIEAQELAVRSNARNVEAMEARVEAGERPVVDLVDAQRDLFAARRDLAELRHQYLIDTLTLKAGAGTLDESDIVALDRKFRAPSGE